MIINTEKTTKEIIYDIIHQHQKLKDDVKPLMDKIHTILVKEKKDK